MSTVPLLARTQRDVNVPTGGRTMVTLFLLTNPQGDPNVPAGEVTFDVDLSRPVTDDAQPPAEAGNCQARELHLPQAYEARYRNFPPTYRARSVYNCHTVMFLLSSFFACWHEFRYFFSVQAFL